MNNPINILYLTKRCNFKCSYCYERQSERTIEEDCTHEQIDKYIERMVRETSPEVSQYNVCLFGGEPFLNVDGMKYFIDTINPILNKNNKSCAIEVITNGSLMHNYVDLIRQWTIGEPNVFYNLCVSYDGAFQYRRTNSDITERNMELLRKEKVPFSISYTVSKENADIKLITKDMLECYSKYLIKDYDTEHYKSKVRINVDNSMFNNNKEKKDEYYHQMRKWGSIMFKKYHIPMCQFTCSECKRCTFSNTGKSYMVGSDVVVEPMYTDKAFNHF